MAQGLMYDNPNPGRSDRTANQGREAPLSGDSASLRRFEPPGRVGINLPQQPIMFNPGQPPMVSLPYQPMPVPVPGIGLPPWLLNGPGGGLPPGVPDLPGGAGPLPGFQAVPQRPVGGPGGMGGPGMPGASGAPQLPPGIDLERLMPFLRMLMA